MDRKALSEQSRRAFIERTLVNPSEGVKATLYQEPYTHAYAAGFDEALKQVREYTKTFLLKQEPNGVAWAILKWMETL